MKLILISCSEDGDHHIEILSEEEFLQRLNRKDYGDDPKFLPELNMLKAGGSLDLNYAHGYILIRGEVIQPKAKTVVQEFTL